MRTGILLLAGLLAAACSDSDGGAPPPPPAPPPVNVAPTAVANAPAAAVEGETVALRATESSDSDGSIASFAWRQTGGPAVTVSDADSSAAQFQAPLVAMDTAFSFELTVTDNDGATATAVANVSVRQAPASQIVEIETTFDGEARAFSIYTPATYSPGAPAVMLLHGGGQSMRLVLDPRRTTSRWLDLAEAEGFLLIAPNGYNETFSDGLGDQQSWNDIRNDVSGRTSLEDDVGFLLQTLDVVGAARGFDADEVFVTGSSNGGIMTMGLLVEQPQRFAGGAAFIAALPEEMIPDPLQPTPIMILNGTEDKLVLFDGGPVDQDGAPTRSVAATVDYFLRSTNADVASAVTVPLPDVDMADGCEIFETAYIVQGAGTPAVTFYEARGGGHNIPDPDAPDFLPASEALLGPRCRDANGVDLANAFFRAL